MAIYVGLGFFDALSVLILMLSMYRFPIVDYKWNVVVLAGIISITSYIIRVVIGVPEIDPLIQIALFFLFLRFVMKTKLKYAALIPTSAFAAYILIQALIFNLLAVTNIIHNSDVANTEGTGTYIIQVSTILTVYLLCCVMGFFRFGFSFIPQPPHNIGIKDRHSFAVIWPAIVLSIFGIAMAINALLSVKILVIVPIGFIMFSVLYYLSYRRDKLERDRIYRTANFRKDT